MSIRIEIWQKKKIGWEIPFRQKLDWKGTRDPAGVPMRG